MSGFIKALSSVCIISLAVSSCHQDEFHLNENADDFFFLENDKALMPVWVQGNTSSKIFLIHVHGGPGGESILSFNIFGANFTDQLEEKYANVYYDQRNSGSSQGTSKRDYVTEEQMAEDLYKLILLLKNKYGPDIDVHIMGTSWGGRLTAKYLINPTYQSEVNSWICISGVSEVITTANSGRDLLLYYADQYIAANQNISNWNKIRDWAIQNDTITQESIWGEQNSFAWEAMNLVNDSLQNETSINFGDVLKGIFFSPANITSVLIQSSNFPESELELFYDMGTTLNSVEVPVLFMYGKFDFVVPPAVGRKAYNNVSSKNKELIIFEHSGHLIPFNETERFLYELIKFIDNIS